MEAFAFLFAVVLTLAVYLLPALIGFGRTHHNRWAILILNIFLGWTALGWIASLVWAVTAVRK